MSKAGILVLMVWMIHGAADAQEAEHRWSLPQLLNLLAARGDSEIRFVEEKSMAMLSAPLRVEGTVVFRKPAYLAKHVRRPVEEHYVIDGDTVTVEKPAEGTKLQLALSDYPALEAFAVSLRAPLAGDARALQRYYRASLGGTRNHWLLALAPIRPELAEVVRLVKLEGRGNWVDHLEIEEAGGDTSIMRFQPQR